MFNHTLEDTLGRQYRFSTGLAPGSGSGPRWDTVIPCRAYARQTLEGIAQAPGDPFNYQLQALWLHVYRRPWARPHTREQLIADLADSIGRGDLKAWRVDSPNWHDSAAMPVSTHSEENDQTAEDTPGGQNSEQPRQQSPNISTTSSVSNGQKAAAASLPLLGAAALAKPPELNPVVARQQRYQARKDLVAATADNPDLQEANERLAFNNDNIIRAEAAEYVYRVDEYNREHIDELPKAPDGLEVIDPKKVQGLEDSVFSSKESGFGAALFKSQINDETMLTFRGTNNGVTGKKDWPTNINQGRGLETEQYNEAMDLARLSKQALDIPPSLVGHSLGGGLASSGVAVTGLPGYTFNSAGLHPDTATRRGGMSNDQAAKFIHTQTVDGDGLTLFQKYGGKALGAGLAGSIGGFASGGAGFALGTALGSFMGPDFPTALGNNRSIESINGGNPISRHGMDQVLDGIEHQKKADIKMLSR